MNEEVKAKWLEALRSGEYKQGTGTLRDGEDNFCCLGVLCDVAIKNGVELAVAHREDDSDDWNYDGNSWYLPYRVKEWADLAHDNPEVDKVGYFRLADLNDEAGLTFAQIADVIEEQL